MSVLTATIPSRAELLAETVASIRGQTFHRWEHLLLLDDRRAGCAVTTNRLAAAARAPWLFPLADDDLALPRCLELLLAVADGSHVTYSPPLVWGESAAGFHGSPPNIPSTALISTEAWRDCGGYREHLTETEDNDLYKRMLRRGAIFRRYAEAPTWVYRFTGSNKSRGTLR